MARGSFISQLKQPSRFTPQQMTDGIKRLQKRIEDLEAFEPAKVNQRWAPEVTALAASIDGTLERVFGRETKDYDRYAVAAQLDDTPSFGGETPIATVREYLQKDKERGLAMLRQAVLFLREEVELAGTNMVPSSQSRQKPSRKVFVVHGHAGEPREAVAGFLRKIEFTPVILHEQSNQGRTIVEKFEAHADVDFAVVLLTPDDVGGPKEGAQQPRARQNVILELGYFIGKLGRQNVCAIKHGALEIPSDIIGVVWTPFDALGAWKTALAKELNDAGHKVDWNKVMGP